MTPPDSLAAPTARRPIVCRPAGGRASAAAVAPARTDRHAQEAHQDRPRLALGADDLPRAISCWAPSSVSCPWSRRFCSGRRSTQSSGKSELAGFRYREMIAYLLLTHISRMFSSMPGLAAGIARDIREGTLKRYLIQPVDMIGYLLSYRVAHKVAYIIMSFLPYAVSSSSAAAIFDGFPDALTLAAYAVSLILSFLVGFFFEASVGMVGFWFLEVTSLLYIVMTLNFFISGHMLPLDLLPRALVGDPQGLAVPVHGLFPGRGLPGQGHGLEARHCTCCSS